MSIESANSRETVWWINRFSERSVRKVLEQLRIVSPIEVPALTTIPIDEIDRLEDEQLRESLKRQLRDVRQDAPYMEVPVVYMPKQQLSHNWSIATQSARDRLGERAQAWRDTSDK